MAEIIMSKVRLSGALTLTSIEPARQSLIAAFEEADGVELDLAEVEAVDLTFIQLIESARRVAATTGKALVLSSAAPAPVRDALQRGGFVGPADQARSDFWMCG